MTVAEGSPAIEIDDVPKLLVEFRRQGANLNQMVRLAHHLHSVDLPEVKAAVQRCAEALAEIVRMCDHWSMKLRKESEEEKENEYAD